MCIQLDFSSLLCFQSMLIPGYPNHDHCKYSMDFLWMREPLSRPFSQVLSLILNVLFKLKPSASSEPSPLPPFLSRLNLTITQVEWFSLILSTLLLPHSDSVLSFAVQSPSGVWLFATPWLQHSRLLCPPLSPGVCSNSCPLSWWCYWTISFSVIPFSICLQTFPASGSFPMNQIFTSSSQSIGASSSVLPMNIQGWFLLGLTGLISLQFKGLLRFSCSTTIQKHQFIGTQPSLWWKSHMSKWLF